MAVFDKNWLKVSATISKRGIIVVNNDLLSDVSLVVRSGDEAKKSKMAIAAHKFELSICSPVFFAMFCGKMAEKSDSARWTIRLQARGSVGNDAIHVQRKGGTK